MIMFTNYKLILQVCWKVLSNPIDTRMYLEAYGSERTAAYFVQEIIMEWSCRAHQLPDGFRKQFLLTQILFANRVKSAL